jgi:hypothetical protein
VFSVCFCLHKLTNVDHCIVKLPWQQEVIDRIISQIEADMTEATTDVEVTSCMLRFKKIEEKYILYYGPFNLELHKLRGKLLTAALLLSKFLLYRIYSKIWFITLYSR